VTHSRFINMQIGPPSEAAVLPLLLAPQYQRLELRVLEIQRHFHLVHRHPAPMLSPRTINPRRTSPLAALVRPHLRLRSVLDRLSLRIMNHRDRARQDPFPLAHLRHLPRVPVPHSRSAAQVIPVPAVSSGSLKQLALLLEAHPRSINRHPSHSVHHYHPLILRFRLDLNPHRLLEATI